MVIELGGYLKSIKCKPKRTKIFKELSDSIRELALAFIPLLDNPEFIALWTKLLEYAL
jgi:hypothetical protein